MMMSKLHKIFKTQSVTLEYNKNENKTLIEIGYGRNWINESIDEGILDFYKTRFGVTFVPLDLY